MLDLNSLKLKEKAQGRLLIAEKNLFLTKEGKPYLRLKLLNRTGVIEGILWDDAEAAAGQISQGQVVDIEGFVTKYQQEQRLRLVTILPVPEQDVKKEELLPVSPRDQEEMTGEFHQVVRKVKNPFLRNLLETVFRDPQIWQAFSQAPAAKAMHHAYLGGLLEHTLSVTRLAQYAIKAYPFLNKDLLLAAALLHDLGKSWELAPSLGFEYTDEGRLLGHIIIALNVIDKKIAQVQNFPQSLSTQLKHLIVSHHGKMEFGSPKTPATLEAICLHMLDDLDAKLCGVHEFVKKEASNNETWTTFHRMHQQHFFIPESFPEECPSGEIAKRKEEEESPPLF